MNSPDVSADSQGSPIADDDVDDQQGDSDVESHMDHGAARKRRRSKQAWSLMPTHIQDPKVKIALSLYKVQQNIYLLDFQRVEVSRYWVVCVLQMSNVFAV
jgi:hypothetical protein